MTKQLPLNLQIEEWTREAAAQWGGNWQRIDEYIRRRFAEMSEADRARMTAEATFTLLDPVAKKRSVSMH
jgi:hypothetical protein